MFPESFLRRKYKNDFQLKLFLIQSLNVKDLQKKLDIQEFSDQLLADREEANNITKYEYYYFKMYCYNALKPTNKKLTTPRHSFSFFTTIHEYFTTN